MEMLTSDELRAATVDTVKLGDTEVRVSVEFKFVRHPEGNNGTPDLTAADARNLIESLPLFRA